MLKSKRRHRQTPEEDPTSIGNVLIEMGLCKQVDVDSALQLLQEKKMGEALLDLGKISSDQLNLALAKQKALRGELGHKELKRMVERTVAKSNGLTKGLDELNLLTQAAVKNGG